MNRLLIILLALGVSIGASARVHTIHFAQELLPPHPEDPDYYQFFGMAVAIDGDSIITIADREGGRVALLYRRGADGRWSYQRTLLDISAPATQLRAGLAMKNGIAVVKLGQVATIWEKSGGQWVQATTASSILDPGGFAISGNSILVGSTGCEADAFVYQKSAGGVWGVTGRIDRQAGVCGEAGLPVDLNYDYAMIRGPDNLVRTYHRNGTQLVWPAAGTFSLAPQPFAPPGPISFQKSVAVASGSGYYRRTNGVWSYQGQLVPIDYANGSGSTNLVKYRDGLVLTTDGWSEQHEYTKVYAYLENAAGGFDHVGIFDTLGWTEDMDVSGSSVVVGSEDEGGNRSVQVFTLPSPLLAPGAIINDFNAGNTVGFEQTAGSQFALAGNAPDYVYRQSSLAGESHAVIAGSDWRNYQSIEADITATAFDGPDRWVGLSVRYVDAANQYYVTWRSSNVVQIKRKVNGVFTTIAETALPLVLNTRHHVKLEIYGVNLHVLIDNSVHLYARDTALTHGRAALMTNRARADFDNVYVSPTEERNVLYKDYVFYWYGFGRPLTEIGGHWQITGQDDPEGLSQTTTTGSAIALGGVAIDDQLVRAHLRLDSFSSSPQGAWFGLFARYIDERNHYYLSIRSSNELQIRKQVNGVITVLRSIAFTASPNVMHEYALSVRGNELHASVDGQVVATALDSTFPTGKYGVGTYRAAVTLQDMEVTQP